MKKYLILILLFFSCEKEQIKTSIMAQQIIDAGTAYDDPSADKQRDANVVCNENFTELYNEIELIKTLDLMIPIGAWNMDSDATKQVNITSYYPGGDYEASIIAVTIKDDNIPTTQHIFPLDYVDIENAGSVVNGSFHMSNKYTVELFRLTGGIFDGALFNAATGNRGYIHVRYQLWDYYE